MGLANHWGQSDVVEFLKNKGGNMSKEDKNHIQYVFKALLSSSDSEGYNEK